MAPYKILKQGYMMKEPPVSKRGIRKKLHRYWFVLVEDPQQVALVYFKNEDSYIARQRNEGFIRVDNSVSINVISEHLGNKNAFIIKSIRTDYTLVPESRYDLHEWLFTLHNAIEAFKTKQRKAEERRRMPQRLRANTIDSINVPSSPPSDTSTTSSLRNLTPTRRAPPAPPVAQATAAATNKSSSSASPRRKPVRPAPIAPGPKRNRSQTQPLISPPSSASQEGVGPVAMVLESPPPSYSDASSGTPHNMGRVMDSLGSGVHPVMDLDIHTEQDDSEHDARYHHGNEGGVRSLRPQSASDTLLLMHQNSASLPDLINCDDQEVSIADGGVVTEGVAGEGRGRASHLQRSASGASQTRHTRHLSLIGHEDIRANLKQQPRDHRKKRSSRRNGSIKLRSRSPPNMPPPPPPDMVEEDSSERSSQEAANGQVSSSTGLGGAELKRQQQDDQMDFGLNLQPAPPPLQNGISGELPSQSSSSSVGFSEVMNTISNIDHELDDIAITPTKPSIPAPKRNTGAQGVNFAVGGGGGEAVKDDFNEEEWLCDVPDSETTPISPTTRPAPDGGPPSAEEDSETEPAQKKSTNQKQAQHESFVSADQLVSGGFLPAATVEMTSDPGPKSGKSKHRVMFKEEVEDIPNYEPRVDQEVGQENEDIPTSVAALKKKLFGTQEQGVTKYKKEGSLSPKYTHPTNVSFESGYTFNKESSPFYHDNLPNVNNNNGLDVDHTTPPPPAQQPANQNAASAVDVSSSPKNPPIASGVAAAQEGLYDPPWETSAVSKFKVIGRMRAGSAGTASGGGKPATGKKERTPPPVSPKSKKPAAGAGIMFGEVSMTEVPTPGSMELRNVHSLERSKHKKERQERQKQRKQEQQQKKEESQRSPPVHSYSLDRAAGHRESSPGAATSSSPQRQFSLSLDRRGAPSPSSTFMPPSSSSASVGAGGEDSLLASITDTLQKQSKYGSDTLLSPPTSRMSGMGMEPQKLKKIPNEVRRSSRGELEKIRAAHRREPPAPPQMGGAASHVTPPPTHSSPTQGTTQMRSSPQEIRNGNGTAANSRMSPQGTSTAPTARSSARPQAYSIPMMSSRTSPPNQKGVAPPTNSAHHHHQNWTSPSRAASVVSPKHNVAPHHSSQILTTSNSINGGSSNNQAAAGGKRRMFSGRPRMAASLDELQTDPLTQVTYDASSKSHIFRSLV